MFNLDKNFLKIESLVFEEDFREACPYLSTKFILNKEDEDPREGIILENHIWEVESLKMVETKDSSIAEVTAVPVGMNSILSAVSSPSEMALKLPGYSLNSGDSSPLFLPKVVNCTTKKIILRNRFNFLEDSFEDPGNAYYIYADKSKIYCNTYKSILSKGVYKISTPKGLTESISSYYIDDTVQARGAELPPPTQKYLLWDYLDFMMTEKLEVKSPVRLAPLFSNCSLGLDFSKDKNWICIYHVYNMLEDPLGHTTVFAQMDLKTISNYINKGKG